jgi:hypothetical protein
MTEYDFSRGKRGPIVPSQPGKTRITIRIDTDIVDWFREQVNRAGGGNYQTLINAALREHVQRSQGEAWKRPCGACCARSCRPPANRCVGLRGLGRTDLV